MGPMHQLRGRLPAIQSKGLLWLQLVKQAIFKPSTGFASNRKRQWTEVVFSSPQELQKLSKPAGKAKSFVPASSIALS
ncbi:hypothetical protein FOXYSP1_19188 [Fusarium oxysporum f. sp. phaseoli]